MTEVMDSVFILGTESYGYWGVLICPEPIDFSKANRAWSYAVRYSAKGLDVPDYEAAIKLLTERHPSWKVIPSKLPKLKYDPHEAEEDHPD